MKTNSDKLVKTKLSQILFSLSATDKEIRDLTQRKNEVETGRHSVFADLTRSKDRLKDVESIHRDVAARSGADENRLRDEEAKIIERRKQLTALGGAKSAKLVERELDIATRVLESLEKTAMEAIQESERVGGELKDLQERVHTLELEFENLTQSSEQELGEIEKKLESLNDERQSSSTKLDDRLRNLYNKVNTRYPGEAVAVAKSGACRSCYRALPAQTFNQVMAGNLLIQCPGCSRILVYTES